MKKNVMSLPLIPILMITLISGITTNASADGNKDVVIINCGIKFAEPDPTDPFPFPGGPVGYEVRFSSSSAGAPTVSMDGICAQAIADILSAGFKLEGVKGTQSDDLNYIFIKK